MRVLGVLAAYAPAWGLGGVVRSMSNLCRAMAAAGADVSVYTTNADAGGRCLDVPVSKPVSIDGVTVTYFPIRLSQRAGWASRAMERALRETIDDYDIVYVGATWQWVGIAASRIARRQGIPYVIGTHGAFHPSALQCSKVKKRLYWHGFLRKELARAAALRFTTEYERGHSSLLDPTVPSFIVPNPLPSQNGGVETGRTRAEARTRWGIADDSFVLLVVTRAHPNKRLDIVLEALRSICRVHPSVRLLLVGPLDNSCGTQLRARARDLGVFDAVVWAGYQDGGGLEACYRASDLFVLPSEHENFCMAAAEAMARGLPVVVSRHVGIAADIEHYRAGVVTEVDVGQVTEAILDLMADPARCRETAIRAKNTARQLYDEARVARLMLRAFEDILAGRRSSECGWC